MMKRSDDSDMMEENIKINHFPKWLIITLAIFLTVLSTTVVFYMVFNINYQYKIYPGIYVGDIKIGSLTPEEAKKALSKKTDTIGQKGIIFIYKDREAVIQPLIASAEGDIAYEIINFDIDNTINSAYALGRSKSLVRNFIAGLNSLFNKKNIPMQFSVDSKQVMDILTENFGGYAMPAQDAKLVFATNSNDKKIKFTVQEEKFGGKIDYTKGIEELNKNLQDLDFSNITLRDGQDAPKILKDDCINIDEKAQAILKISPITLFSGKDEYKIASSELASWLTLVKNPEPDAADKILVDLNQIAIVNYLDSKLAQNTNKEPTEARFEIKDGRVQAFQTSKNGVKLDSKATALNIIDAIDKNVNRIELVVTETKSEIQVSEENNLGINEIIGTGHSNFKGSPANRRHNIKTGANALNGILIKPDEIFSLVKTLGEIDGKNGYLPELVIKGNKTTPEFGGGLCQIGTTVFRAALATGLPIVERRNHSYRVSYYEPAGTDATIYSPSPDLKFKNDTGNYILIQSRSKGDDIYFDFWGTKDGRIASSTYPVIYNIKKPGPTIIKETLDLKPGVKKCTESSHNGADAYFNYKVTYSDGKVSEKKFTSHYVPWRAVCLVGVDKLSTSTPAKTD